jgi:hypothetical protein
VLQAQGSNVYVWPWASIGTLLCQAAAFFAGFGHQGKPESDPIRITRHAYKEHTCAGRQRLVFTVLSVRKAVVQSKFQCAVAQPQCRRVQLCWYISTCWSRFTLEA